MLPGGKQKCMVNLWRVSTCYIVKHDIREHKQAGYIEGHGKSGPGKSRDNQIQASDQYTQK